MKKILVLIYITLSCSYTFSNNNVWHDITRAIGAMTMHFITTNKLIFYNSSYFSYFYNKKKTKKNSSTTPVTKIIYCDNNKASKKYNQPLQTIHENNLGEELVVENFGKNFKNKRKEIKSMNARLPNFFSNDELLNQSILFTEVQINFLKFLAIKNNLYLNHAHFNKLNKQKPLTK